MAAQHEVFYWSFTDADGRTEAQRALADYLDRRSLDGWELVSTFNATGIEDEPVGESECIQLVFRRALNADAIA